MHIRHGVPGNYFLTADDGDVAVWKILDGADLESAHELGYAGRVAALVATWDELNPPHSPKTDENDLPHGMTSLDEDDRLDRATWTACPRPWPMFELNDADEWIQLPAHSERYH